MTDDIVRAAKAAQSALDEAEDALEALIATGAAAEEDTDTVRKAEAWFERVEIVNRQVGRHHAAMVDDEEEDDDGA